MKSRILTLALVAIAAAGIAVSAQRPDYFAGIELTAEQRQQIEAITPKHQGCANCDSATNTCPHMRDQRVRETRRRGNADSVARREVRHEARRAYLDKIKAILTPEQYVQYLENVVTASPASIRERQHGMQPAGRGQQGRQHHQRRR